MNKVFLLMILAFSPLFAQTEFDAAGRLYDEGKFSEALEAYQSIEGQSAALDYNIGNTLMRLNKKSEAIAYYRRALWQKPSDPDIRANLDRAAKQTSAVLTPLPLSRKLSGFMKATQWQSAFILSCWLCAGLGIASLKFTALRNVSAWIFPLLALFILLLGAGVWASRLSSYFSEAIVKPKQATALFEPLPDATERFLLSEGSTVTLSNQSRNWYKVSTGSEEGWIPSDQLILLKELGK